MFVFSRELLSQAQSLGASPSARLASLWFFGIEYRTKMQILICRFQSMHGIRLDREAKKIKTENCELHESFDEEINRRADFATM